MDGGKSRIVSIERKDIQWDELMSVTAQAFDSIGFVHNAQILECDIPAAHQPFKFSELRTLFLGGFWVKCLETLCRINGLSEKVVSGAMMIILSTWLLERSVLDRSFHASNVLENASCLSVEDHKKMDEFVADTRKSLGDLNDFFVDLNLRKCMLKRLELVLPSVAPTLSKKMLKLIKYGIDAQIYSCVSHNTKDVSPLYCDHSCSKDQLPTKTIQVLTGHKKQVWCVKFSHNGLYLASGSVDCTAIIWEVPAGWELRKKHVLQGHMHCISFLSWSPNDESLLTCAPREHIKMWDVRTGICTRVISEESQVLRSCAFLNSDPIEIVYGTSMFSGSIRLLRNECDSLLVSYPRLEDRLTVELAVTPNGRKLIYYDAADDQGELTVKCINTSNFQSLKTGTKICGISVSEDNQSLLVNLINNEIHVLNLNRLGDQPLIYWNFEQIIDGNLPCVGGVGSSFLVSGTGDSKVCIWNRRQARPIAVLSGHTSVVKCVSWNPQRPQMLASASDDNTIRIWGPQCQEVPYLFRHD